MRRMGGVLLLVVILGGCAKQRDEGTEERYYTDLSCLYFVNLESRFKKAEGKKEKVAIAKEFVFLSFVYWVRTRLMGMNREGKMDKVIRLTYGRTFSQEGWIEDLVGDPLRKKEGRRGVVDVWRGVEEEVSRNGYEKCVRGFNMFIRDDPRCGEWGGRVRVLKFYEVGMWERRLDEGKDVIYTAVAVSGKGKYVAVGDDGGRVEILRGEDGEKVWGGNIHEGMVLVIKFTEGGILSGGDDGVVEMRDVKRGVVVWRKESRGSVVSIEVHEDIGKIVSVEGSDVVVRRLKDGNEEYRLRGTRECAYKYADFWGDWKDVVARVVGWKVYVCDLRNGGKRRVEGMMDDIVVVDRRRFLYRMFREVGMVRRERGELRKRVIIRCKVWSEGLMDWGKSICWLRGERIVVVGSSSGMIFFVGVEGGKVRGIIDSGVGCGGIDVSVDEKRLVVMDSIEKRVRVFSLEKAKKLFGIYGTRRNEDRSE